MSARDTADKTNHGSLNRPCADAPHILGVFRIHQRQVTS